MNIQPNEFLASIGIDEDKLAWQHVPNAHQPLVTIVDRHCGYGKTTGLIADLANADRPQLIVVPYLSEVFRFIDKAGSTPVRTPLSVGGMCKDRHAANDYIQSIYPDPKDAPKDLFSRLVFFHGDKANSNKQEALRELIGRKDHIVTTHSLFSALGLMAKQGLLMQYDIHVDEILNVAEIATPITTVSKGTQIDGAYNSNAGNRWRELYVENGYVTIEEDTGKIVPTDKWRDSAESVSGNLSLPMFTAAEAGRLYTDQKGIGPDIILSELPVPLIRNCHSMKVYTYLFTGSYMCAFLQKHNIAFTLDEDKEADAKFRMMARELITIKDCGRLSKQKFSYSEQAKIAARRETKKEDRLVSNAILSLVRSADDLKDVDKTKVMVTCVKDCWIDTKKMGGPKEAPGKFAKGSRIFEDARFVSNKTRGTNMFSDCSHLLYFYEMHPNANVAKFLGMTKEDNDKDAVDYRNLYAVSELLQLVYRSRVRNGQPITLYLPSDRMKRLLNRWLDGDI